MKKFIIAVFAMLTIFLLPSTVKASDFTGGWVNGRAHDYSTYGNWLYAYGANTNYPNNPEPWYIKWFKSSDGVIIKNTTGVGSAYYFVTYNPVYQTTGNSTPNGYPDWNNSGNLAAGTENPPDISAFHDVTFNSTMNANSPEPLKSIYNAFNWDDGNGAKTVYVTGFKNASNFQPLSDNYDLLFTDIESFYDGLEENDFKLPLKPGDPDYVNSALPMLNFNISAKTIYKFPLTFDTKEILSWDYSTLSPYKENPTNYSMEIVVSGNLNNDKTIDFTNKAFNSSHTVTLSNGGTNVAENAFSWLAFATGKKFYGTYGWDFPPFTDNVDNSLAGYLVYVRTKDNTDPSKYSAWKIFSVDGHGIMSNVGYVEDDDGVKPKPENNNDSGNPTIAPEYSSDNSTSAESDPTGQNFDGAADYNPSTLLANLKAIVNTLQELPTLLGQIFTFFPDWFLTLIIVSIGMLVVIGVVKTILN